MKRVFLQIFILMTMISMFACGNNKEESKAEQNEDSVQYLVDRFDDVKIMRYTIPGWDDLSLDQKELIYYLSQAAIAGRDIIYDQNYKYNLRIRKTFEEIYKNYDGDREDDQFKAFEKYLKKIWFANGIHHHYSKDKFKPDFDQTYFETLIANSPNSEWPLLKGESIDDLKSLLNPVIFDPTIDAKAVSFNPRKDLITASACNFYENVTQKEVEAFYNKMIDPNDTTPISYGLNSKLIKDENGEIMELTYKVGGMYSGAIEKIVYWLEKARKVAENDKQATSLTYLIDYYKTGDLEKFDAFNIEWVSNLEPMVDFVNGFTEVYGDPMGMKATWESVVNFKNMEATKRTNIISQNAQWFEDNSPIDDRFKKDTVKGVSAKVITVAHLGGDCYPTTPIGINLPNADWIRKEYGSKSVTMDNITYAYDQVSQGSGSLEEFAWDDAEVELIKKYGYLGGNLHTDMHECLGHGSGQLLPGTKPDALKNYASVLEEARADLFALYYLMDDRMVELGLIPSLEVAKAEYVGYIKNGLMLQLKRIELGKDIEQAHMRNRQLIASWVYEKGKKDNVIEKKTRDNKTFFVINDYKKLRELFAELLKEVQRIKSEGDYAAGKELVEAYAVKVDPVLHKEVLDRYEKLQLAAFGGFINPSFELVMNKNGKIKDIKVNYDTNYADQNLFYSAEHSFLPFKN
jgi:dipeptidyl-peptidase-3